jgi:hypothetical protein
MVRRRLDNGLRMVNSGAARAWRVADCRIFCRAVYRGGNRQEVGKAMLGENCPEWMVLTMTHAPRVIYPEALSEEAQRLKHEARKKAMASYSRDRAQRAKHKNA